MLIKFLDELVFK
uniref:Uncharacterized protein n=1 Tax=Arundo donax TaxID=35708 RepID=A0A0A9TC32_ARUDO